MYPVVALVRASLSRYSITGLYQGSVGASNYARLLEHRTPLVEATGGDEVVEEAGEVASAQGLGEVG